jgi:hypothetical protein
VEISGYHRDKAAFLRWQANLVLQGARLINAPEVLRWNLDKSYLLELKRAGAPVAPVLHFPIGSRPGLQAVLAQAGWERYVLKPTTSANAENAIPSSTSRRRAPRLSPAEGRQAVGRFM